MPIIGIPPDPAGIDPIGIPCGAGVPIAAGGDVLVCASTPVADATRMAAIKTSFREGIRHSFPI
jgi:hypothetical protein